MPACGMIGCPKQYSDSVANERVRLFCLPTVIKHQCSRAEELSRKRRSLWLSRINRKWPVGKHLDGRLIRVCNRHFINGKPSTLFDFTNPDWAPSLLLGYETEVKDEAASINRYFQAQARRNRKTASNTTVTDPAVQVLHEHQLLTHSEANETTTTRSSSGSARIESDGSSISALDKVAIASTSNFERDEEMVLSSEERLILQKIDERVGKARRVEHPNPHSKQNLLYAAMNGQPKRELVSSFTELGSGSFKKHVGCQVDIVQEELVELLSKYHDSVKRKQNSIVLENVELRSKLADQIQQNTTLSEQLASTTEQVRSLMASVLELQVEKGLSQEYYDCLREENIIKQEIQDDTDITATAAPLPTPLTELFDWNYPHLPFEQVKAHCERVFSSIAMTKEEAINLEKVTRGQGTNPVWMHHKAGRITASVMKNVCNTDVQHPSVSLIKTICYPQMITFSTVHARGGLVDDQLILEEFERVAGQEHQDMALFSCGVILNPKYPFLFASPDALVYCSCHGTGIVEVKSMSVDAKENTGMVNGLLDKNHTFSYQIQTQMLVCNLKIGFLVKKKPNHQIRVHLIERDLDIQAEIAATAGTFFQQVLLPELVCKYFSLERHLLDVVNNSSTAMSHVSICICKEPPCAPMINCVSGNCPILTYHKKCVGITRKLTKWICPGCRKP